MSIQSIRVALNAAIRAAAQRIGGKSFSRKSTLTAETVIRLLISAEGGSLAKILHDAGIQATASALSQRRAQIPPEVFRSVFKNFNSSCTDGDLFRGYKLLAVDGTAVNLPRNSKSPSFVQNDGIPNGVNQLHVTPCVSSIPFGQKDMSNLVLLIKSQFLRKIVRIPQKDRTFSPHAGHCRCKGKQAPKSLPSEIREDSCHS